MLSKAKIKYIQSLDHKKLREESGVFIAETPKVVEELLRSNKFSCRLLCATRLWLENATVDLNHIKEVEEVELFELKKISSLSTPHDVVAVFEQAQIIKPDIKGKFSIILDGIRDPGNLGTIIRIADWFGVENIICSNDSVNCYNPKVVQATMGSLSRVNIVYADLHSFVSQHAGIRVYGATLTGSDAFSGGKVSEAMLIIGNESSGIRQELLTLITTSISIPRTGNAESLNAAVACGILVAFLKE